MLKKAVRKSPYSSAYTDKLKEANQDGLSQSSELTTLTDAGIQSLNVTRTEHSQTLANGNQLADLGNYTKADGSQGSLGEVTADLADINLVQDTFHSQFTDHITLTTLAATLPDMQGAGLVRDLREAASLSDALAATGNAINGGMSAVQMRTQVNKLLGQWADTSDLTSSIEQAAAQGMKLFYLTPGIRQSEIEAFRDLLGGRPANWTGPTRTVADLSVADRQKYDSLLAQQQGIERLIRTLEGPASPRLVPGRESAREPQRRFA